MTSSDRHDRLQALFLEASRMAPHARRRFLEAACRNEPTLRAEVEALLESDARSGDYLDMPSSGAGERADPPAAGDTDAVPTRIGPYRVLGILGSGGMGEVYLAEQTEPVARQVALKVIKLGMDTKQVLARFEAERQALAMMDHPNVARLFDASATEQGRPYFVMEYVPGTPITEYADRHRLLVRDRLELFQQVCDAVQHAHQKGLIHRDLKPGNVLVTVREGRPVVKVIDFGVAKAIGKRLTEHTVFTEQGELIGTPEYMSPEQAELTAEDIDTRTDVYALGMLLYELLTGTLPYDRATFRSAGLAEIRRLICHTEPPKPSTRLTRSAEDSTTFAEKRRTDVRSLAHALRGDLDWIVMKALEKDRTRRYATASELAADVRRHLAHEPVVASPPGTGYRLKKFVRRNRAGVATAVVVAASLMLAAGVSLRFAFREAWQREIAATERDIAQAVNAFLTEDLLAAVAPSAEAGKGRDVLMREVLDEAAKRIDATVSETGRLGDKPMVEAAIRRTIGNTYSKLGEYDAARPHLERALAIHRTMSPEDRETLRAASALARLYADQGNFEEAETLQEQTLETRRSTLGENDRDTLESMNALASVYREQGRYEEAEQLARQTLDRVQQTLGEDDLLAIDVLQSMGVLYLRQGRHDDAESVYTLVLDRRQRVLGPKHPTTLASMSDLAHVKADRGHYEEADRLYLSALELTEKILGENHPQTMALLNNLATSYKYQGRNDEVEPLMLRGIAIAQHVLGEGHVTTLGQMNNLAILYKGQDRHDEAEDLYRRTMEIQQRLQGEDHPQTLVTMVNFAWYLHGREQYDDALAIQDKALVTARTVWPADSSYLGFMQMYRGATLGTLERFADAEAALKESHAILEPAMGAESQWTLATVGHLVKIYEEWGKPERAAVWQAKLATEQAPAASP